MYLDSNAIIEVVKSFARFIYFGVIGLVGTFLVSLASNPELANAKIMLAGTEFSIGFILVAGIGGLSKVIDRYVHKSEYTDKKGIAPGFLQG